MRLESWVKLAGVVPLPATPLRGFADLSSDKERLGFEARELEAERKL